MKRLAWLSVASLGGIFACDVFTAPPTAAAIRFLSSAPESLVVKGAGVDRSELTFQVQDSSGKPVSGVNVDFALSEALGGAYVSPTTQLSDANGEVRTMLHSGDTTGTISVTATSGRISVTSHPISIAGSSTLGSIQFVSAEPETLLLKGAGVDSAELTFSVKDATGQPFAGASVDFSLSQELGGAYLSPTTQRSDAEGNVRTTLNAGNAPGTVRVTARSGEISGLSTPISIGGALANHAHFEFACPCYAIEGLTRTGLEMSCRVDVADKNGQKLSGIQVTFLTEAGSLPSNVTTDGEGTAVVTLKTQDPRPRDVAPDAAASARVPHFAFGDTEPSVACGPSKRCNPRDGVATMIAVTTGEEAWTDVNGNGKYDVSEPFDDLSEPYVDLNDSGSFDANEQYVDTNDNHRFDAGNGLWDSNATIWREIKIVFTGGVSQANSTITPSTLSTSSGGVPHCGSRTYSFRFVDANLNAVAHCGGYDQIRFTTTGNASVLIPAIGMGTQSFGPGHHSVEVFDTHDCNTCEPTCSSANSLLTIEFERTKNAGSASERETNTLNVAGAIR